MHAGGYEWRSYLCARCDDGCAGLVGLNGRKGRGCHHPFTAATVPHAMSGREGRPSTAAEKGRGGV